MNDTTQKHEPHDPERDGGSDAHGPDAHEADEAVIDEPVLDGATEHEDADVDPRKGLSDPALIRDIDAEKKTVNPYG